MDVYNQISAFVSTIPPVVQILLIVLCAFIIRKLLKPPVTPRDNLEGGGYSLPPMKKRDFTVKELLQFDGIKNERVLLAVCGKVFDVTKGKSFYGPGLASFLCFDFVLLMFLSCSIYSRIALVLTFHL